MTLTDHILLRFVDGQLPPSEAAAVEAALARDHVAAERVRLMRLSGAALEVERKRSPDSLDRGLVDRALGAQAETVVPLRRPTASMGLSKFAALAAALALIIGFGGGWLTRQAYGPPGERLPVWVMRVVDYHTLYARETVDGRALGAAETAALEQRFGKLLDRPVKIPTFDSGMEFRRGQVLQFERNPIVQLAYLPEQGMPIALCFKRDAGADLAPAYDRVNGVGMVRWRKNGAEYVLVGEQPETLLRDVAQRSIAQIAVN